MLGIKHLIAAKLAAFTGRGMGSPASKDFGDLVWIMASGYGTQVLEASGAMSVEQRRVFVKALERVGPELEAGFVERAKHLLGLT